MIDIYEDDDQGEVVLVDSITAQMLRDRGACNDQVNIFAAEWPGGAEVTLENCLRAAELGFNFDWAANVLLPSEARQVYRAATKEAWRAYDAARAATVEPLRDYYAATKEARRVLDAARAATKEAWRAYDAATKEAWRAYDAARAATKEALRDYYAATKEALRVYDAATKEARRVYDDACATAFFEAAQTVMAMAMQVYRDATDETPHGVAQNSRRRAQTDE